MFTFIQFVLTVLVVLILAFGFFAFGFFFSRANGEGTDADKIADKVDKVYDEKLKEHVDKAVREITDKLNSSKVVS